MRNGCGEVNGEERNGGLMIGAVVPSLEEETTFSSVSTASLAPSLAPCSPSSSLDEQFRSSLVIVSGSGFIAVLGRGGEGRGGSADGEIRKWGLGLDESTVTFGGGVVDIELTWLAGLTLPPGLRFSGSDFTIVSL